ncbi:hypothetical protein O3P69_001375 [Scylla paramamosain]|uniref:Uncharacterized protein n=1 Tax=Scylla paramamosain TaxID=85552 RepID=A0AAW0UQA9_SCYPA
MGRVRARYGGPGCHSRYLINSSAPLQPSSLLTGSREKLVCRAEEYHGRLRRRLKTRTGSSVRHLAAPRPQ